MRWLIPRRHVVLPPVAELRGWVRSPDGVGGIVWWRGHYFVWNRAEQRSQSFEGRIKTTGDAAWCEVFILNPPAAIGAHPSALCFFRVGASGWHEIGWNSGSADVSECIAFVEHLLSEAFDLARRQPVWWW